MLAARFPRMSEQEHLYRTALDLAPGKPITFRTLDIGSDKVLPYMTQLQEENPALGWRAIRIGLDRPALLRSQLRAMLRAAAGRDLRIMFPMIASLAEIRGREGHGRSRDRRICCAMAALPPSDLKVGIMVEVPSLLWELDGSLPPRRFYIGRLERSDAIFLRRRPRQQARLAALRSLVAALSRRAEANRRHGPRRIDAADAVRRNRRQAA